MINKKQNKDNLATAVGIIARKGKRKTYIVIKAIISKCAKHLTIGNTLRIKNEKIRTINLLNDGDKILTTFELKSRRKKRTGIYDVNCVHFMLPYDQAVQFSDIGNKSGNSQINNQKAKQFDAIKNFVFTYTPSMLEEQFNERIIGQPDLTKAVADFIYYHALRQIHRELPPRPMLIAGPSGSGKTEIWRVAKKLFGDIFNIEIVDGATITSDGWKGNNKVSTHINEEIANGGILVFDEFDKTTKPKFDGGGSNVGAIIQSEFLKLLEGEYEKTADKNPIGFLNDCDDKIPTKQMGIVLVGAFEDIKRKKQKHRNIGFNNNDHYGTTPNAISDEELITFGVIPEVVGRIGVKITTRELSDDEYVEVIFNKHSRISTMINVFKCYGIDLSTVLSEDEIRAMIETSKDNQTGVRWVSSQVESKMIAMIHEIGVKTKDFSRDVHENSQKTINAWQKQIDNQEEFFF